MFVPVSIHLQVSYYYQTITETNAGKILEMNTLGVSSSYISYASGGLNPPCTAEFIIFVLYGTLDIGFLTMMCCRTTHELSDIMLI